MHPWRAGLVRSRSDPPHQPPHRRSATFSDPDGPAAIPAKMRAGCPRLCPRAVPQMSPQELDVSPDMSPEEVVGLTLGPEKNQPKPPPGTVQSAVGRQSRSTRDQHLSHPERGQRPPPSRLPDPSWGRSAERLSIGTQLHSRMRQDLPLRFLDLAGAALGSERLALRGRTSPTGRGMGY